MRPTGRVVNRSPATPTAHEGYDETDEIVAGRKVYRRKPTADVLSYVVDTDDQEAVEMHGMNEPFRPPKGYRIHPARRHCHARGRTFHLRRDLRAGRGLTRDEGRALYTPVPSRGFAIPGADGKQPAIFPAGV